jgi:tetratricopeptide (TPR) repeat protein
MMRDRNSRYDGGRKTLSAKISALALSGLAAASLLAMPALAGSKDVDWDKKLAKPRHLAETNNVEEAIKIYVDLLKKYPEAGVLHTELGKGYKVRGKMSMAKAEFRRSTEVDANFADAWYELGAMEESDKEYQLASDSYEKYLQLQPASDRKAAIQERIQFCKNKI